MSLLGKIVRSQSQDVRQQATQRGHPPWRDEKGAVLLLALLFLGILLSLGTALLGLSLSEHQVAVSHRDGVQALYLADLGIEKAKSELNKRLDANVAKVDFDAELTTNNAYLFGAASGAGAYVTFSVGPPPDIGTYRVWLENNTGPDPGGAADDQDKTVWAESEGVVTTQGHIRRKTVRALLGPRALAAFTTGCDSTPSPPGGANTFTISGNPNISGSQGSIHSNCDLTTTGTTTVSQNITAVGTMSLSTGTTNGGIRDGDAPPIPTPVVNPADFKSLADYILTGDGKVKNQGGTVLHDAATDGDNWPGNSSNSWQWADKSGANRRWQFSGSNVHASLENKAFYFEKSAGTDSNNVSISGSPPTGLPGSTWKMTVIAEGYIDASGNPTVQAADSKQNLLFVAGTDIKIGGSLTSTLVGGGVLAAHEQIKISGNGVVTGFFLAENAAHTQTLVENTVISGNITITYNGLPPPPGLWRLPIVVQAWREK